MNSTTDVRSALRDLFQFHLSSHAWLPALLMTTALGALVVLVGGVLHVRPGPWVPPGVREGFAYRAVICWVVSTFCAYAAGFVMARLYVSEEPVVGDVRRGE
jgi:hypothetical protein